MKLLEVIDERRAECTAMKAKLLRDAEHGKQEAAHQEKLVAMYKAGQALPDGKKGRDADLVLIRRQQWMDDHIRNVEAGYAELKRKCGS
ncbi:hypothetical protein [Reyranella sp.]|uniref:hypothetical protein n=1 Tax=Reyranella sp. TaxID=1929291 RepID=UPI003783566D